MANITPVQPIDLQSEIADWQSAVYGEEVRGAAVSALQKIQGTVNDTVTNVNQAAENAAQAVEDISGAITQTQENAQAAAGSAEAAAGFASAAETSKGEAATSASNAAASAEAAAESAEKAAQVEGFDGTAATVKATDTYGLVASALGESNVQALIDAIADRVLNQLVNKSQIINNLLATQPGNVLDAVQGAALKGLVDQNTEDIAQLNGNMLKIKLVKSTSNDTGYVVFTYPDGLNGSNSAVLCFIVFGDRPIVTFAEAQLWSQEISANISSYPKKEITAMLLKYE